LQKRQRRKGKGKGKKPQPVSEVIIEESSSEDSDEPNPINVDASGPEINAEHEHDLVHSSCVTLHIPVDGVRQGSDIEVHKAPIGEVVTTKGETTKDLDLMFLKKGTVNFKTNGKDNKVKGRWCITCNTSCSALITTKPRLLLNFHYNKSGVIPCLGIVAIHAISSAGHLVLQYESEFEILTR